MIRENSCRIWREIPYLLQRARSHDMARRRPVTLYKYCPPERFDVLQNGKIRFTPPAVLNDPFEMSPSLLRRWMASDVERAGNMEEASAILRDGFAADQRTAESLRSEVGVLSLAET